MPVLVPSSIASHAEATQRDCGPVLCCAVRRWYYENAVTDATGALWGGAPQSWYSRLPGASGSVLRSVIIFPSPSDSECMQRLL